MFNGVNDLTLCAAEVNDVKGSIRRVDSPTVFTVRGSPFENNNPSYPGYSPNAPQNFAPPPARHRHGPRPGMFAGVRNLSMLGAEVNHADDNIVRQSSGTYMTIDNTQGNQNPVHGNYHPAAVFDNTGRGTYNANSPYYVNTPGGQYGPGYDYPQPPPPPNPPAGYRRHAMPPSDRGPPYYGPGGVLRQSEPYPGAETRQLQPGPNNLSVNRFAEQPVGTQIMRQKGPRHKKKFKKERSRRAERAGSESEEESQRSRGISRVQTY
ncbi:hypothetical protein B0H17DRAFT_1037520 [Mycena rosella]|uniref:Uncharacterized protein n=1 Tax=Mycena rosella TaxID=1033263 RepID=A0AAD7GUA2_MYCRO|nr:hypothetical protein B0H17DRAFT_1037520 [Mycena rosella]